MRKISPARIPLRRPTRSLPPPANVHVSALESADNQLRAIEGLKAGRCIELTYDGCDRVLEVHTVGRTTAGNAAMCAYQVDGTSNTGAVPGWRLFCFDQCVLLKMSAIRSLGPRLEHKRGAKQFSVIFAEL